MKLDVQAANRIKFDKGFSLGQIAIELGTDKSAVSQWFNAKRGISLPNAVKLAALLRCTIGQLAGKEPYASPDPPSTDEGDCLIKIEETVDEWYKGKGDIIIEALRLIVESGGAVRITGMREGCVEITVRLTHEQQARLQKAFAEGKLAHLNITAVQPVQRVISATAKTNVIRVFSVLSEDLIALRQPFSKQRLIVCKPRTSKASRPDRPDLTPKPKPPKRRSPAKPKRRSR